MSKKNIILLTVFVDVLGLGIVIPVLPFYVESFGVSDFVVTMLFAVFSFFSFFSAPFLGALSDRIGRRPVLLISIASTALGWFIFASAKSIFLLFLGRIIDGIAAGNMPIAQSYLVDISENEKDRTANLGVVGAIFGIAFIIGPLLGGFLGSISHTLPFWFVAGLATLNLILAYWQLPETHHNRNKDKKLEINPLVPIIRALKDKKLLPGFVSWFLFGLAIASQQSVFSLYLGKVFGYQEFVAGLFLTGVGVLLSINQGLLLKRFWLKRFSEKSLELWMFLVFSSGFFLMGINALVSLVIGLIFTTIGQSTLRVVMTSQMVGSGHEKRGETLGILTSIISLSFIIGPLIGGYLFLRIASLPFFVSGFLGLWAFVLIVLNRKRLTKFVDEDLETGSGIGV